MKKYLKLLNINTEMDDKNNVTKQLVLTKALELFATVGYCETSTRDIAILANVNQASIAYYFQSKEGLYKNVVLTVTKRILADLDTVFHDIEKRIELCQKDRDKIRTVMSQTIAELLNVFWLGKSNKMEILFFQKELAYNKNTTLNVQNLIYEPIMLKIQTVLSLTTDHKMHSPTNYVCAAAILDLCLSLSRYQALYMKQAGGRGVVSKKKKQEILSESIELGLRVLGY